MRRWADSSPSVGGGRYDAPPWSWPRFLRPRIGSSEFRSCAQQPGLSRRVRHPPAPPSREKFRQARRRPDAARYWAIRPTESKPLRAGPRAGGPGPRLGPPRPLARPSCTRDSQSAAAPRPARRTNRWLSAPSAARPPSHAPARSAKHRPSPTHAPRISNPLIKVRATPKRVRADSSPLGVRGHGVPSPAG